MSLQQTNPRSPNRGQQGQEIRHTVVGGAHGGGYREAPKLERGSGRPAVAQQRMQGVSPTWSQQHRIGDSPESIAQQMQSGQ